MRTTKAIIVSASAGTNHLMNRRGGGGGGTRPGMKSGRDGAFSSASSFSSWGVGSSSTDVAARSKGPQWSQSAACMINCFAFNSGHSPAATSCQSTSSSLGQLSPGGAAPETTTLDERFTSRLYFDTLPLQSRQDCT